MTSKNEMYRVTLVGGQLDLNGVTAYNCLFKGCRLQLMKGKGQFVGLGCIFDEDCVFIGDGWPPDVHLRSIG